MTSSVNFRMHFGKKDEWETILFPGHSIRLLDLKKEIAEKKKILLTNLDFDLQVTENETGKVFKDDNEYVPKNSSVIAKRIPIVNGSASLALKIRGAHGSGGTEIVMQTRAEEVPEEVSNLPVPSPQIEPVSVIEDKRMDEQEEIKGEESVNQDTDIYLKEERDYEMELSSAEMMTENELTMLNDIQTVDKSSAELASSVGGPRGRPGTGPLPDRYICPRCGKPGHFVGRCPTNNDPTYDKQRSQSTKLYAISTGSRKKVTSLDNIDTKTNTVIQRKDGSYEVIESSQSGLRRLEREGDLEAKVDPSEAPEHLRCVFSGQLLKEAVELPCCKKCVNDSAIRQYLLSGVSVQLKCPVCQVENLSPDSLLPRPDIRSEVENYILSKTGKEVLESSDTGGGNAKLPPPPPPPGPPPPKPMSGGFPPVDMYGMPLGPMGAPPGFMGGGPMMFPGGPMGPYGPQMGGPPGFFPPHIMPPHMMPPHMMDPRWGPYGFDPAMVMPPDMPPDEFMRMQQQQQQQRQGDGPHGDRFPRGPSGGRPNFQKRSNDDGRFRSFQPREFNRGRSRSASRQRSQPRSDSISGPAGDERSAPKLDKIKEVDEREEGRTKHQTRDEVRSRGEKDDGRGDRRGFDSRDRAGNIDTRDRDRERDRSRDRDRDRDRDKDKGDRGRERERGDDTRDDRRDHNYDRDRDRDRGRERAREPRDDRQEKDRTRERDRERNSDRDRVRDQDRGEVKERDSEKDRKSKEKDKDRERDKDKEKVRDRDRDRDREKEHKDKRRDRDAPALDKYKEKTSELDPDDTERDNKKDEKKKRHREGRSDGDSDYNKTQKTLSSGRVVMTEESSKEKHRHR